MSASTFRPELSKSCWDQAIEGGLIAGGVAAYVGIRVVSRRAIEFARRGTRYHAGVDLSKLNAGWVMGNIVVPVTAFATLYPTVRCNLESMAPGHTGTAYAFFSGLPVGALASAIVTPTLHAAVVGGIASASVLAFGTMFLYDNWSETDVSSSVKTVEDPLREQPRNNSFDGARVVELSTSERAPGQAQLAEEAIAAGYRSVAEHDDAIARQRGFQSMDDMRGFVEDLQIDGKVPRGSNLEKVMQRPELLDRVQRLKADHAARRAQVAAAR